MPFFANTPESLLKRSDSLDQATTCRGVTGSGKPCRRALGTDSLTIRVPKRNKRTPTDLTDVSLYCWQHQDQAARHAVSNSSLRLSSSPRPARRSSIDTLTERLGLTDLASEHGDGRPSRLQQNNRPGKAFSFCCFTIPLEDIDGVPPPRPLQQTSPSPHPKRVSASPSRLRPCTPSNAGSNSPGRASSTSQTGTYLSLIPTSVSPQTASSLMAELAKPISKNDEAGYIYIFWLTPENEPSTPPREAARDLLAPPSSDSRRPGQRRPSDVLAAFANTAFDTWFDNSDDDGDLAPRTAPRNADADRERRVKGKKAGKKTILLKIGRATNVQRRLNEWQRQCGYNLSLIRYYPYVSSSSPTATPRKMPHSHKVERLIHLELAGAGLRVLDGEKCDACGREHREWFEVEATRNAVREIDEVVRRWAEWDEKNA